MTRRILGAFSFAGVGAVAGLVVAGAGDALSAGRAFFRVSLPGTESLRGTISWDAFAVFAVFLSATVGHLLTRCILEVDGSSTLSSAGRFSDVDVDDEADPEETAALVFDLVSRGV